ncbi:hypothetical protein OQA88_1428 [Cercophora sp. LCS_1]
MSSTTSDETGASEGASMCPDWIFSPNSTVHIATSRAWFTDYRPHSTTITTLFTDECPVAIGIGTVDLPVKRNPKLQGAKAHGTIRLHNVLHVPDMVCNILGGYWEGELKNCKVVYEQKAHGSLGNIVDENGKQVAYLYNDGSAADDCLSVKISGAPVGPEVGESRFREGVRYLLAAFWDGGERKKWVETAKTEGTLAEGWDEDAGVGGRMARQVGVVSGLPEIEDKRWVLAGLVAKGGYGGEWEKKMKKHEREQVKGKMAVAAGRFGERPPDGPFNEDELQFIAKRWGNEGAYLSQLSITNPSDARVVFARVLLRAMIMGEARKAGLVN